MSDAGDAPVHVLGLAAAPGRSLGVVRRVSWDIAAPPHRTIQPGDIDVEIERFERARAEAIEGIRVLRERTASTLGEVEAKIFDPQILMLEDPELVEGTRRYVRENFLAADRAFDWRITEIRMQMLDTAHLMMADRLADLMDIRVRVLSHLDGRGADTLGLPAEEAVLLFEDLTPSVAVRLDPARVLGLVIGAGSRTAHSAILARSLGMPTVVGVGSGLSRIPDGATVLMDGDTGRIVVNPGEPEIRAYHEMEERLTEWRSQFWERPPAPVSTADGRSIHLRANLDQPHDVRAAERVGAEGVGLFRTEFLVIGQRVIPSEQEQYDAYRFVLEGVPGQPVTLRTFDIGGDKFPLFLDMPPEENPYLGWRAIRVCLDLPDLFRNQLRAVLRAHADYGRMRILLPFVTSLDEVLRTREILAEVAADVGCGDEDVPLGIMVETPAVVETLDLLAPHIDFVSLGTNDLSQYTLAVDRGNARLAHLADPLHPALVRMYHRIHRAASAGGLDIGVCGDLASNPIGLSVLVGLGYRDFSLAPTSIPEIRELLGTLSATDLAELCEDLEDPERVSTLKPRLGEYLRDTVPFETSRFSR